MAPADLLSSQIPPNNNLFEEVTANLNFEKNQNKKKG